MTQDNKECSDMNSTFEKLRIASDGSGRNISDKLDMLKPKNFTSNWPNLPEKAAP